MTSIHIVWSGITYEETIEAFCADAETAEAIRAAIHEQELARAKEHAAYWRKTARETPALRNSGYATTKTKDWLTPVWCEEVKLHDSLASWQEERDDKQ